MPYHHVNDLYQNSRIFINTSDSEGFPNSFLQSWIRGVPVISFFDPDNTIQRENIGSSPDDIEEMVDSIKRLLSDDDLLESFSLRAESFAMKHYSPSSIVNGYLQLFEKNGILDGSA